MGTLNIVSKKIPKIVRWMFIVTATIFAFFIFSSYLFWNQWHQTLNVNSSKETIASFGGGRFYIGKVQNYADLCDQQEGCLNYLRSYKLTDSTLYVFMSPREFTIGPDSICFKEKTRCVEVFSKKDIYKVDNSVRESPLYMKLDIKSGERKLFSFFAEMTPEESGVFKDLENNPKIKMGDKEYLSGPGQRN